MLKIDSIINHYEAAKLKSLKSIKELLEYFAVKVYLTFALVVNIFTWLFARYIYTNIGQDKMALHYSVDFGIDLYGGRGGIFVIPVLGFLFLLFNIFLLVIITVYNKRDSHFLSHLILSTVMIANTALLLAIFTVYLINFR
ncbi:MAG: hypothetical protein U9Q85_04535 [Patescibacteria group bacterium]|nr:hypothetical protein [Patescibacteria group bacterium]